MNLNREMKFPRAIAHKQRSEESVLVLFLGSIHWSREWVSFNHYYIPSVQYRVWLWHIVGAQEKLIEGLMIEHAVSCHLKALSLVLHFLESSNGCRRDARRFSKWISGCVFLIATVLLLSLLCSLSDGIALPLGKLKYRVTLEKALQVSGQFVAQQKSWDSHLYSPNHLTSLWSWWGYSFP